MSNNDDFYHELAPRPIPRPRTEPIVNATAEALDGHVEKVGTHGYMWVEGERTPVIPMKPTPRGLAFAATGVNREISLADERLKNLRNQLKSTADKILELDISVGKMTNSLYKPGSELADAKDEIARLEKRIGGLIKEAQRQKRRADRAEIKQADVDKSVPGEISFLRRTPGDAIRYFASEVMKHAEADTNAFLAGAAMGLRMVADDVDRLPQG